MSTITLNGTQSGPVLPRPNANTRSVEGADPLAKRFDVRCTVRILHTDLHLEAHVELEGDPELHPGDTVQVHGGPMMAEFGESQVFHRTATITRAGLWLRIWTRFKAWFEITELYEVNFTAGRGI